MDATAIFLDQLMSVYMDTIVVPMEFTEQAQAVEELQKDDVTGLVDSLTDFAVDSANVDFSIETDNDNLNKILDKWLKELNKDYRGLIPPGIKALAREYFKERWKGSSFPVLKIIEWDTYEGGLQLPTKMFFVKGGDIVAQDKKKGNELNISGYDYYLGETKDAKNKLEDGVIFSRPYGRWYDKYPVPYIIKRGIYHNAKIIEKLKKMGQNVLQEVIPYLLLVRKGDSALANQGKKYTDTELTQVFQDIQDMLREYKNKRASRDSQTRTRVTNYDEEIKHLIPDLATVFTPKLFEQAERNILSGLGFVDIIEGVSDSRRESVLNPKVFIKEVHSAVEDFKSILFQLLLMIKDVNSNNRKYMEKDFHIVASPVKGFMTDKFKQELRLLWKGGQLSNRTYCELVGETDYKVEKMRRDKELKDGDEVLMYPHVTDNRESDITPEEEQRRNTDNEDEDVNGNPIDDDKINEKEKYEVSITDLETAPYTNISELPKSVRDNMTKSLQRTFMRVVNKALDQYDSEDKAFRIAWSVIKRISKKNKAGKWVRKSSRIKASEEIIEKAKKETE